MGADMAGVAALRDGAIGVWGAIGVDRFGTVVLIIALTLLALHAGLDLSSDADAIADFDGGDLGPDFDGFTNDFVSDAEREGDFSPAAGDAVNIRAADAAAFYQDVNVVVFEGLWFELERYQDVEAFVSLGWANIPLSF